MEKSFSPENCLERTRKHVQCCGRGGSGSAEFLDTITAPAVEEGRSGINVREVVLQV